MIENALAEGSSQQAAGIEETSASLEYMAAMTQQNADHARQADALMNEGLPGPSIPPSAFRCRWRTAEGG